MYKKLGYLFAILFFLFVSSPIFASWQVAKGNSSAVPSEPFFQTNRKSQTNTYSIRANKADYKGADVASTSHRVKKTYSSYIPSAYTTSVYPRRNSFVNTASPVYAISISGSLKENLERIMHRYNWKVVWNAPYDYNFDGRITGTSLPTVIEKLLKPFPLQAQMYMSNRTLAVISRNPT
jgi:hypothetical protein